MEERPPSSRPVPPGMAVARILIVSGLGFSAALGIFLLVGGIWQLGLAALAAAIVLLLLMFAIERGAS